jgi:putative membrane protein
MASGSARLDATGVSDRLDAAVRDNRFTIAVVFPVVGAALFVASSAGWLPAWLAFNPALVLFGTLVMRSPLVAGLLPVLDRRAVVGIAVLVAYTYGVELLGVLTGLPYGEFAYGIDLGPMLFGLVPVGLPVFFVPLVLNAYLLVLLLGGRRADRAVVRVPAAIAVVLAVDLVLDPAAVSLGFWRYAAGGAYYGVPTSNFLGWSVSATVAVGLLDASLSRPALRARLADCEFFLDDLVSFVVLWGTVNAYFGNWLPVVVAAGFAGALVRTDRFDFAVVRRGRPTRR